MISNTCHADTMAINQDISDKFECYSQIDKQCCLPYYYGTPKTSYYLDIQSILEEDSDDEWDSASTYDNSDEFEELLETG